jgi:hypothetical protein
VCLCVSVNVFLQKVTAACARPANRNRRSLLQPWHIAERGTEHFVIKFIAHCTNSRIDPTKFSARRTHKENKGISYQVH